MKASTHNEKYETLSQNMSVIQYNHSDYKSFKSKQNLNRPEGGRFKSSQYLKPMSIHCPDYT
jgi:hypothetical protein